MSGKKGFAHSMFCKSDLLVTLIRATCFASLGSSISISIFNIYLYFLFIYYSLNFFLIHFFLFRLILFIVFYLIRFNSMHYICLCCSGVFCIQCLMTLVLITMYACFVCHHCMSSFMYLSTLYLLVSLKGLK